MADHWKSIANLLGAPGVDLPEESSKKAEQEPESTESQSTGGDSGNESEPKEAEVSAAAESDSSIQEAASAPEIEIAFGIAPAVGETEEVVDEGITTESRSDVSFVVERGTGEEDDEKPQAKIAPEPEVTAKPAPEKKRRKSTWESLASMFNLQVEPEPEQPVENISASVADQEMSDAVPAAGDGTSATPPAVTKESAVNDKGGKSSGAESKGSSKRTRSSADPKDLPSDAFDIASVFHGGVEEESQDSAEEAAPSLSIFADDEGEENPALEAMFSEAPREGNDAWQRKRRVVDDLGWDDDEPPVSSEPEASDERDARSDPEENAEAPARSSRSRRGRRGRRGENRDRKPESKEKGPAEDWEDTNVESSTDDWSEPDTFRESDDGGEDGVVERRSNRRRRRGRSNRSENTEEVAGEGRRQAKAKVAEKREAKVAEKREAKDVRNGVNDATKEVVKRRKTLASVDARPEKSQTWSMRWTATTWTMAILLQSTATFQLGKMRFGPWSIRTRRIIDAMTIGADEEGLADVVSTFAQSPWLATCVVGEGSFPRELRTSLYRHSHSG